MARILARGICANDGRFPEEGGTLEVPPAADGGSRISRRMIAMPVSATLRLRRACRPVALVATAVLLVLPLGASQAQTEQGKIYGKKFAAYEFQWYPIHFVDHFEADQTLSDKWERLGTKEEVTTQTGMLTIRTSGDQTVGATLRRENHDRGRWEIRLRGQRYETENTDFTVAAELIPAGDRSYNCGARNIALASFRPESHRTHFYARNLPDREFTGSKRFRRITTDYWHTYGVEVRPKKISWFVDGEVRATERRPEALSGIPLAFRLQLQAVPGATMNESRLQVDTVRYFTLESPRAKRIPRAPQPVAGTYADACPDEEPASARK